MKTKDTRESAYAEYKLSCAACDIIREQLFAPDAFKLCGGTEGWKKLCRAYDCMRDEQTRRKNVWLESIGGARGFPIPLAAARG